MDEFSQYEVQPYAGRGSVNPPMVGDPQPGGINPNLTTIGTNRLSNIRDSLSSGIVGAAHGLTAGTFDYIPAGAKYWTDRLTGKAQDGDFPTYLDATRRVIGGFQQQAPVSYGAGDVTGAVGLGYLTGGSSLPLTMATQGAQGAIRKYIESPETTLEDAAKAGALQGAIPAVLGAGTKILGYAGDTAKNAFISKFKDTLAKAEQSIGRPLTGAETSQLYNQTLSDTQATPMVKALPGEIWNESVLPAATSAVKAVIGGKDPITGALRSAGTVAATKLKVLYQAGQTAAAVLGRPLIANENAISDATKQIIPMTSGAVQPSVVDNVNKQQPQPVDEFEQYRVK